MAGALPPHTNDRYTFNLYTVLGLSPEATPDEVTKASEAALESCNPNSFEAFLINRAHKVLSDQLLRRIYDSYGTAGLSYLEDTVALSAVGQLGIHVFVLLLSIALCAGSLALLFQCALVSAKMSSLLAMSWATTFAPSGFFLGELWLVWLVATALHFCSHDDHPRAPIQPQRNFDNSQQTSVSSCKMYRAPALLTACLVFLTALFGSFVIALDHAPTQLQLFYWPIAFGVCLEVSFILLCLEGLSPAVIKDQYRTFAFTQLPKVATAGIILHRTVFVFHRLGFIALLCVRLFAVSTLPWTVVLLPLELYFFVALVEGNYYPYVAAKSGALQTKTCYMIVTINTCVAVSVAVSANLVAWVLTTPQDSPAMGYCLLPVMFLLLFGAVLCGSTAYSIASSKVNDAL